jgi:hypothetical protein
MELLANAFQVLRGLLPKLGPYVLVEIALPGGTLLALLLYVYRRMAESRARAGLTIGSETVRYKTGRFAKQF